MTELLVTLALLISSLAGALADVAQGLTHVVSCPVEHDSQSCSLSVANPVATSQRSHGGEIWEPSTTGSIDMISDVGPTLENPLEQ